MNLHEYLVRQNKAKLKESKTNTDHCDLCHEAVDNGDDYYTSYGSHLCEECWDEYLKTEKGAVELFITLARDGNKESLSKYSAEELDKAVASWKKNKNKLATADDLDELETRAKAMGLLKEGTKLKESKTKTYYCDKCDNELNDFNTQETAYGETICEDCWDDYINTEEGLVEYVLNIANGEDDIEDFPEDQLEDMKKSWKENRTNLDLTAKQLERIEKKLKAKGFEF